jgi:hypothetical protein
MPLSPDRYYQHLPDRAFCASFFHCKYDVKHLPKSATALMLDNGAFSAHTKGITVDWKAYYAWCEKHLRDARDWCVVPDVIAGTEEEQDLLIKEWPSHLPGAPVWHLHETLDRLRHLAQEHPRVCLGSSKAYWHIRSSIWFERMDAAFETLESLTEKPKIHMLRGLGVVDQYPFTSADSTNLARSFKHVGDDEAHNVARLLIIRSRTESLIPPKTFRRRSSSLLLHGGCYF